MMDGISSLGSFTSIMQQSAGMQRRPDPEEMFNKLDTDGNGGIDQAELNAFAEKIAAKTGEAMNVEETFATADTNADGLLGQEEMDSLMTQLRETMGGPPKGGMPPQQALAAYEETTEDDSLSLLMEMLADSLEDDEEPYSPLDVTA